MPNFYSELQNATLENLASDPANVPAGRIIRNTVDGKVKVADGSNYKSLVTEDGAQTLTNKTLTSPVVNDPTVNRPIIDVITLDDQGSTPSTPGAGLYKIYVKTDGRAYILNPSGLEAGLGGGGGGGALQWVEGALAPYSDIENNAKCYFYQAGLTQDLFADIRIPSSYAAGVQIKLRVPFYSPDTSGNVLLRTQSTLIRTGTDAITSTTNQRTSTNAAVTLSVANQVISVEFDLTSSSGQINSVGVSAGDIIRVRMYRDTDTATSDVRTMPFAAEVVLT